MLMLVHCSGEAVQASSDTWRARSVRWRPLLVSEMAARVDL